MHSILHLYFLDELVELLSLSHSGFNITLAVFTSNLGLFIFLYQPVIAVLVVFLILRDPDILFDMFFHHAHQHVHLISHFLFSLFENRIIIELLPNQL